MNFKVQHKYCTLVTEHAMVYKTERGTVKNLQSSARKTKQIIIK